MTDRELVQLAIQAMERAYAPYSHYKVGAALLTRAGDVYLGCNIENVSYTPTNCAERTAFFKAISEGEYHFEAIAVVGGKDGKITGACPPCGVCRQVMAEFCDGEMFRVLVGKNKEGDYDSYLLKELLPVSFKSIHINTNR